MLKCSFVIAAGLIGYQLGTPAFSAQPALHLAQFGPPPPGSAFGSESATYGSRIGTDVRGSGAADIMDPNDVIQRTDPQKKKEEAERKERDAARDKERLDPRSNPAYNTRATERAREPGSETGVPPVDSRVRQPGVTPGTPGSAGTSGTTPGGSPR